MNTTDLACPVKAAATKIPPPDDSGAPPLSPRVPTPETCRALAAQVLGVPVANPKRRNGIRVPRPQDLLSRGPAVPVGDIDEDAYSERLETVQALADRGVLMGQTVAKVNIDLQTVKHLRLLPECATKHDRVRAPEDADQAWIDTVIARHPFWIAALEQRREQQLVEQQAWNEWVAQDREDRRRERGRAQQAELRRFADRYHRRSPIRSSTLGESLLTMPSADVLHGGADPETPNRAVPWLRQIYRASMALQERLVANPHRFPREIAEYLSFLHDLEERLPQRHNDFAVVVRTINQARTTAVGLYPDVDPENVIRGYDPADPESVELDEARLDRARCLRVLTAFDPAKLRGTPIWHTSVFENSSRKPVYDVLAPAVPAPCRSRLVEVRPGATSMAAGTGERGVITRDNLTDPAAWGRHRAVTIAYYLEMSALYRRLDPNRIFGIRVEWNERQPGAPGGMWRQTYGALAAVIRGALPGMHHSELFAPDFKGGLREKDGEEYGLVADFHPERAALLGHVVSRTPAEAEARRREVLQRIEQWIAETCAGARSPFSLRVETFPAVEVDQVVFPEWCQVNLMPAIDYTTGLDLYEGLAGLDEDGKRRRRAAAARRRETWSMSLMKAWLAQADLEEYLWPEAHVCWNRDDQEDAWHRIVEARHPRYHSLRGQAGVDRDESIAPVPDASCRHQLGWGKAAAPTYRGARDAKTYPKESASLVKWLVWSYMYDPPLTLGRAVALEADRILAEIAERHGLRVEEVQRRVMPTAGGRERMGIPRMANARSEVERNRKAASRLLHQADEEVFGIDGDLSRLARQVVAAGLVKVDYLPSEDVLQIVARLQSGESLATISLCLSDALYMGLTGGLSRNLRGVWSKARIAYRSVKCPILRGDWRRVSRDAAYREGLLALAEQLGADVIRPLLN